MTNTESELSRRQRLAEVWRTSAPSREEIVELRAWLAQSPRRSRTSRGKVAVVALVQGLFFGAATLAAAAFIAGKALPRPPIATVALPTAVGAPSVRAPGGAGAADDAPVATSAPTAVFDEPADVPRLAYAYGDDALRSSENGKARPHALRAPVAAPASPRPAASDVPAEATNAGSVTVGAAPTLDGPWTRVAQALSEKDWTRADRVLTELASSPDPATRDAADLTRAELAIARGSATSLRPLVERLARSGATGLIRKRAAALLERLP